MLDFQSFPNPVNEAILDIEKEEYESAFGKLKGSMDFWLSDKSNKIKACHALKKIGLRMQSKKILSALENEDFESLLLMSFEDLQIEKKEAIKNVFLKHNIVKKVEEEKKPTESFSFPVLPKSINANIQHNLELENNKEDNIKIESVSEGLIEKVPEIPLETQNPIEQSEVKEVIKIKKYTYFLSMLVEDENKQLFPTRILFKSDCPINTFKGIEELSKKMQNKKWALLSYLEIME